MFGESLSQNQNSGLRGPLCSQNSNDQPHLTTQYVDQKAKSSEHSKRATSVARMRLVLTHERPQHTLKLENVRF